MRIIKRYKSPDGKLPVECFINGLDKKQRAKIHKLLYLVSHDANALKPPHVKSFRTEKYKGLSELRVRLVKMIRIIFYLDKEGNIILLHAFLKNHERSTEKALEASKLKIAEINQAQATIINLGGVEDA